MTDFEKKIASIRKAFQHQLYEPALALALSLPDICASIEFPQISTVTERYIKWSNNHISMCDNSGAKDAFSGSALYQLRCRFLHNGHSNIFKDNGTSTTNVYFYKFDLMSPNAENVNTGLQCAISTWKDDTTGEITYTARMNLSYIIDEICSAAETFFDNWADKSAFDEHSVNIMEYTTDIHTEYH